MLTSWGAAIVVFQQTAASLAGFHTAPPTSCSSSLDAGCLNYRVSSHKRSAWSLARRDLVNPAASQGKLFSKSHSFTLISPFFFPLEFPLRPPHTLYCQTCGVCWQQFLQVWYILYSYYLSKHSPAVTYGKVRPRTQGEIVIRPGMCNYNFLSPVFWLVGHWLWRRALPSRTLSTEVLRPKCESSLHLKTLAHPSSVRVKLSAVSVFPKLNSPQWLHQRTIHSVVLCQIEDPDKAAIRKVSQIQVICEPKKEKPLLCSHR